MDNIIVVDKTPSIYRIKEIANKMNLRVIETTNSIQTINRIRASDDIKLVIIDVVIEKEDGFKLIEEIKVENPRIPIVILTALNGRRDFVRGIKVGAADYILKPFDDDILIDRIKKVLSGTKAPVSDAHPHDTIDFNSYLDAEISKSLKGNYPLSIGMIVLFKHEYDPDHPDSEYMKYQERLYKKYKKIFFETDLLLPYGSQTFLTVMPFCSFDNIHIVRDKILKKSSDFIDELSMSDYRITTAFVNLPKDGTSRDILIDKLMHKIQENIG